MIASLPDFRFANSTTWLDWPFHLVARRSFHLDQRAYLNPWFCALHGNQRSRLGLELERLGRLGNMAESIGLHTRNMQRIEERGSEGEDRAECERGKEGPKAVATEGDSHREPKKRRRGGPKSIKKKCISRIEHSWPAIIESNVSSKQAHGSGNTYERGNANGGYDHGNMSVSPAETLLPFAARKYLSYGNDTEDIEAGFHREEKSLKPGRDMLFGRRCSEGGIWTKGISIPLT